MHLKKTSKLSVQSVILITCFVAVTSSMVYTKQYSNLVDEYHAKLVHKEDRINDLESRLAESSIQLSKTSSLLNRDPVTIESTDLIFGSAFKSDKFTISAYSPYDDVSGINADSTPNETATGTVPRPGTMAVDPKVIPYGSTIIIMYPDGTVERGVAEDTGGAIKGNRIDTFRYTYRTAMKFGMQDAVVIWYKEDKK